MRRRPLREGDQDLEPASGPTESLDSAARARDDVLDDREPEARPPRGAGSVGAVEALEQAREVVLPHADAGVPRSDHDLPAPAFEHEREARALARIAERVLGEVLEDDAQHPRAERYLGLLVELRAQRQAGALGAIGDPGEDLPRDGGGARHRQRADGAPRPE